MSAKADGKLVKCNVNICSGTERCDPQASDLCRCRKSKWALLYEHHEAAVSYYICGHAAYVAQIFQHLD